MAINSIGTKLYAKVGVGAYAEVSDLLKVPDILGKPEKIDTTNLSASSKTFIMGVRDPGDLAFKFNFDNSGAATNFRVLKGYDTNGTLVTWKVYYRDGTYIEFDGYVSCNIDAAKVNDKITFTATVMVASAFTTTNP